MVRTKNPSNASVASGSGSKRKEKKPRTAVPDPNDVSLWTEIPPGPFNIDLCAKFNEHFYVPNPEKYDNRYFPTRMLFDRYFAHFKNAPLCGPSSFPMLDLENHYPRVFDMLNDQGWLDFVSYERSYSPTLVRMFYANLDQKGHKQIAKTSMERPRGGKLTSTVLGKPITVRATDINEWFGCELHGICMYSVKGRIIDTQLPPRKQWATVAHGTDPDKVIPVSALDPMNLLLFHVVFKVILPRVGHSDKLTGMETYVMACLEKRLQIDLGYIILCHMARDRVASGTRGVNLPYPSLVMHILHKNGVDVPRSTEFTDKHSRHTMAHITRSLQIKKNSAGLYEYIGSKKEGKLHPVEFTLPDSDDEEEYYKVYDVGHEHDDVAADMDVDDANEEDDVPNVREDHASGYEDHGDYGLDGLSRQLDDLSTSHLALRDYVHHGFERMDAGFERMDAGFARMDAGFARMDAFSNTFSEYMARFPPPPPPQ